MELRHVLLGSSLPWRFAGEPALTRWLCARPWVSRARPLIVHLDGQAQVDAFLEALRRQALGWSGGIHDDFAVSLIEEEDWKGSVVATLEALMGISAQLRERKRLELLAKMLGRQHRLFVFALDVALAPDPFEQQASTLLDLLNKQAVPGVAGLVLLDASPRRGLSSSADYTQGLPQGAEEDLLRLEQHAWPAYLHLRLAWEVGGRWCGAAQLAEEMAGLGRGDDDALEARLNRAASGRWASLDPQQREELLRYVTLLRQGREGRKEAACSLERLVDRRLAWCPSLSARARLIPQVARAMLVEQALPKEDAGGLRSALGCAPLARFQLGCCLDLELALKAASNVSSPLDDTARTLTRYLQEEHPALALIPSGSPSVPQTCTEVASLGELAGVVHKATVDSELFHRLRTLRNHLAHGGYSCWRGQEVLVQVTRRVSLASVGTQWLPL